MVCKEMSADRPDRDGSRRPVTTVTDGDGSRRVSQFSIDLENIHCGVSGVMVCKEMSADRPDRDGS